MDTTHEGLDERIGQDLTGEGPVHQGAANVAASLAGMAGLRQQIGDFDGAAALIACAEIVASVALCLGEDIEAGVVGGVGAHQAARVAQAAVEALTDAL